MYLAFHLVCIRCLYAYYEVNCQVKFQSIPRYSTSLAAVPMLLAYSSLSLYQCRPANDPQLMTYRAYLDSFYLPTDSATGPGAAQINATSKDVRKHLKQHFTEPDQPGAMFRQAALLCCKPKTNAETYADC